MNNHNTIISSSKFILGFKKDGLYNALKFNYTFKVATIFTNIVNDYLSGFNLFDVVTAEVNYPSTDGYVKLYDFKYSNLTEAEFLEMRHFDRTVHDSNGLFDSVSCYEAFDYIVFDFDANKILVPDFESHAEMDGESMCYDSLELEDLFSAYKYIIEKFSYLPDYYTEILKENKVVIHDNLRKKPIGYKSKSNNFIVREYKLNSPLIEMSYNHCCSTFGASCSCTPEQIIEYENALPF